MTERKVLFSFGICSPEESDRKYLRSNLKMHFFKQLETSFVGLVIFLLLNLISFTMSENFQLSWGAVHSAFQDCTIVILSQGNQPDRVSEELLHSHLANDKFLIDIVSDNHVSPIQNVTDVHQFRDRCVAAFVTVPGIAIDSGNALYKSLRNMDGVVKTDEDFFLFHSASEIFLVALFSSGPVASGVKNKVGVKVNSSESGSGISTTCYATCFFCAGGNASLYTFKIEDLNYTRNTSVTLPLGRFAPIHTLFPDLLKTFHGKRFKISYPVLARWLIDIRETSPGQWGYQRGVMTSAMDHLMYKYNFSGEYFASIGGGTGYRFPNGTWVGTVGDVLYGRTEIGQCTGQIVARNMVVGFAFPTVYEWLTFTTGEPQPHYSWKSVYWPFTPLLWLLVIASVIIAFFVLSFLLAKMDQRVSIARKVTFLLTTMLEQDAQKLEKTPTHTTRVFLAFWLIFTLLITTSYRSKLVSFLAFPVVEDPPKTFEGLAHASKFHIALQYIHGAAYSLLKSSPNPTFQTIFQRMELEENDAKCFQQAIGTRYSCISWDAVASFVYHKNLSDKYGNVPLIKARDTTSFIVVGLIFPKRAVIRTKFDAVLFRAMDMGLPGKWKELDYEFIRNERKHWEVATNRSQVVYARILKDVLTMQNLSGTFFIFIVGLILALALFTTEFFVWIWKKKFKRGRKGEIKSDSTILRMFPANATEAAVNPFQPGFSYD